MPCVLLPLCVGVVGCVWFLGLVLFCLLVVQAVGVRCVFVWCGLVRFLFCNWSLLEVQAYCFCCVERSVGFGVPTTTANSGSFCAFTG